jgi:hypothetical protein
MTVEIHFARKVCPSCQRELPSSAYNKRRTVAGSVVLQSKCRECQKAYAKAKHDERRAGLQRKTGLPRASQRMQARNPKQHAARKKLTAAFHRTPAFIAAGDAAMQRAGGQCEYTDMVTVTAMRSDGAISTATEPYRCPETFNLERHCLRYPKTRPIEARDIQILCPRHHHYIEMTQHSYRHQGGRK